MPKRITFFVMTVTFLIAVNSPVTYPQNRQRGSGRSSRQPSAPTKSPLTREAELENQKFWETLFVKCGDSYFGEVAPGLSQMRGVTFSVSSQKLTGVDKENGYEWRGSGVMRFSRRRMLSLGRWLDWVSADQDWIAGGKLTAILRKKNGEWSALYSPFDRNIIAKRPTCEWLSQFGIEAERPTVQPVPQPAAQARTYGFNVARAIYVVQAFDRVPTKVEVAGYDECVGEFWGLNHVASLKCAKPKLDLLGTATPTCPGCTEQYEIEWNDSDHSAQRLGLKWDIMAAFGHAEIRDIGNFRILLYPDAAAAMTKADIKLDKAELVLKDGRRITLRGRLHSKVLILLSHENELIVNAITETPHLFVSIDLATGRVREGTAFRW